MKSRSGIIMRIIVLIYLVSLTGFAYSQVTLNCESGNRAIEQGNCWGFGAVTYSNTASLVISGSWSTKSNSLTNASATACWIKTPWMLVGNGNITFQTRLDGLGNGVSSKGILVAYIPYVSGASYGEGNAIQFYTYNFPAFNVTTVRDISIPIPAEIKNSSVVYKFRVSFIGTGGNERAYADNFIFPGTYWSDPSSSCGPKAVILDADGDGVPDSQDNYPNDPYRAYNNYYPSNNTFGTLAFEDCWPHKSDYDMNDVVTDYHFNTVTNGNNQVVEIIGKVVARASGASFKNGLGFQLDGIAPNKISSFSGNHISSPTIFEFQPNGLEANQTYANFIVFDNFYKVLQHPGAGSGINVSESAPFVPYDTIDLKIQFINHGVPAPGGTVSFNSLSANTFNFYIVSNQIRGNEIHLADRVPTNLANTSLFGTGSDNSNPAAGKYYKTANNLPWGINVVQGFQYPNEKNSIDQTYLHFVDWAVSSGAEYPNWYMNQSGFRDNSKIYH
ncbi:MAG: LruC domain-containing protein [Bacteroidetes bacterium]|nr:LruC domain-containing protein [Bacteroidota bacterium]